MDGDDIEFQLDFNKKGHQHHLIDDLSSIGYFTSCLILSPDKKFVN